MKLGFHRKLNTFLIPCSIYLLVLYSVVASDCSCSGSPVHALFDIVGKHNVSEAVASEITASSREFYMQNYKPRHLMKCCTWNHTGEGFCVIHNKTCVVECVAEDLFFVLLVSNVVATICIQFS